MEGAVGTDPQLGMEHCCPHGTRGTMVMDGGGGQQDRGCTRAPHAGSAAGGVEAWWCQRRLRAVRCRSSSSLLAWQAAHSRPRRD